MPPQAEGVMTNINVGRVVQSGIIIGLIVDIVEAIFSGWLLDPEWAAALANLNQPPFGIAAIIIWNVWGLIIGLATAWIYVGFRPRFGPGPLTALYAGLTVWVVTFMLGYVALAQIGMPADLMIIEAIVGLFEITIGAVAGAYFYRE
jgi:hypothetical protein